MGLAHKTAQYRTTSETKANGTRALVEHNTAQHLKREQHNTAQHLKQKLMVREHSLNKSPVPALKNFTF
jgi:hypothetical protein